MDLRAFRRIILPAAVAVALLAASLAIPRNAVAQQMGPGVDEIIFSVVDQPQAVQQISDNTIDVFIFTLEEPSDKIAARDDPNIKTFEAFSGINDMYVNPVPHGTGVSGINPFQFREVREALQYALDREYVVNEIYGGFATSWYASYFRNQPDWTREAGYFAQVEQKYKYNPALASDIVAAKMATVEGVSFDTATGKWLYQDAPIVVKLVQRIEDLRFQIGEYVATEIEKLGFTVQLDPSTGLEAFFKVYAGDSTAGEWHIYTEGWIFGAIIQFDDGQPNFFYNGDFGSDVWGHYTPPPSLTVPCVALERAEYTTLDERSALLEACTNAGVRDAVRVFLVATKDVSLAHTSVSDAIFAVDAAFNNWWTLKAAIKGGVTGGTLRVGQPIHTVSGWNNVGGFTWVYEEYQRKLFSDEAVPTHPHTGTSTPFRADYVVDTVGPDGKFSVPTDAQVWNSTAMAFENAGSGVEAASKVTYTFKFGNWHHGQAMTMDDIRWSMAEFFRIVQSTGDLNPESPSLAAAPGFEFVNDLFRGAKFYEGNDTVEVWFDFWNPDTNVIASFAPSWWTTAPWEIGALLADTVNRGECAYGDDDADDFGIPQCDLVKGPDMANFATNLASLKTANFIPPGMGTWITSAEATARWAALDQWFTDRGHYYVSNGPFYVHQVTTDPESTTLRAFRTGYPIDLRTEFKHLASIVQADVTLRQAPRVVQTFPATFAFDTTFQGQTYDRIQTAAWLLSDPGTGAVLFSGEAARTGAGAYSIELSGALTGQLVEGTYTMTVVVATQDSVIPTFTSSTFRVLAVGPALLEDLTKVIDDGFADIRDELDALQGSTDDAHVAVDSAVSLIYIVLGVAIAGIAVGAIGIVLAIIRRKPPTT